MNTPVTSGPETVRTPPRIHRALSIIAAGTILALLYFARDVLVPITLAVILSLAVNPLVRLLRRLGLGAALSALAAVLFLVLACASFAVVIGTIFAFQSFGQIDILTQGGPLKKTNVLTYYIYDTLQRQSDPGKAAVLAVALFFLTLILALLQIRLLERRVSYER